MIIQKPIKNIVLVGMMGSGKSLIAKSLSKKLKIESFSIDELIELKEKCSISNIVKEKGWDFFRELESKMVKKISNKKGVIIDCGGGVVLNPKNFEFLRKHGIIFFLKANPQVLYNRLKGDKTRPLINEPKPLARLKSIYKERLPLYNQADFTIDASDPSIQGPVAEILKIAL